MTFLLETSDLLTYRSVPICYFKLPILRILHTATYLVKTVQFLVVPFNQQSYLTEPISQS